MVKEKYMLVKPLEYETKYWIRRAHLHLHDISHYLEV